MPELFSICNNSTGTLHDRTIVVPHFPQQALGKPNDSYTQLLIRQHKQMIAGQTGSIGYRKVVRRRYWPFHKFAKTVAQLMGKKAAPAVNSNG